MELNKNKRIFKSFWSLKFIKIPVILIVLLVSNSCTVSYKFNGAYIDYTKIKTISIADFVNTAELVYAPLSQEFTEKLRDVYTKSTRLQMLKKAAICISRVKLSIISLRLWLLASILMLRKLN